MYLGRHCCVLGALLLAYASCVIAKSNGNAPANMDAVRSISRELTSSSRPFMDHVGNSVAAKSALRHVRLQTAEFWALLLFQLPYKAEMYLPSTEERAIPHSLKYPSFSLHFLFLEF